MISIVPVTKSNVEEFLEKAFAGESEDNQKLWMYQMAVDIKNYYGFWDEEEKDE